MKNINIIFAAIMAILSQQSFASTAKPIDTKIEKKVENKTIALSKITLTKIALVNPENEFERNISVEQFNALLKNYINSLNILTELKSNNDLQLEITFEKDSQSFNIQTTKPITKEETATYQKVYASLKSIKKPEVKEKLKLIIFAHSQII